MEDLVMDLEMDLVMVDLAMDLEATGLVIILERDQLMKNPSWLS
jgi:hypothetical protein